MSDGTAITFTYLDRFTVQMPREADIAYKLGMCARWWRSLKPTRWALST